ncbi:MAG: UDP-3-O-(3-hydroxymyristoyl)glucosamine N-acyltransferase [candidate division NC10 bacterium]|nr:UDP-3-O-(3-hydroxymyristoyl)glucosamine N-acyltransferase [candidate division NC10 bacterium]
MEAVTLRELAERLECRLEGEGGLRIGGLRPPEEAGPGDLTFVADARHLGALAGSSAGAVLMGEALPPVNRPTLRAANPQLSFARALALLHPPAPVPSGIHPTAVVAPDAVVEASASVGPLCVVETGAHVGAHSVLMALVYVGTGVRIGTACRIYPQVTLREGVEVGDRVILHSGAVIGADGFGYARDEARHVKIPQIGRVVLEDDVEVGANTAIDRATLAETRIGRGTKIDNLVQIGHNVSVGEDTIIVSQAGISGSARIGARVTLAGQVGIVDHVTVGDGAIVGAQAGVPKDVPAGAVVLGAPAIPHLEFKRQLAALARLPELRRAVRVLEARLQALEDRTKG